MPFTNRSARRPSRRRVPHLCHNGSPDDPQIAQRGAAAQNVRQGRFGVASARRTAEAPALQRCRRRNSQQTRTSDLGRGSSAQPDLAPIGVRSLVLTHINLLRFYLGKEDAVSPLMEEEIKRGTDKRKTALVWRAAAQRVPQAGESLTAGAFGRSGQGNDRGERLVRLPRVGAPAGVQQEHCAAHLPVPNRCLRLQMRRTHSPEQNGLVERVIRTLKEQFLPRHRFESLQHASPVIGGRIQTRSATPALR